MTISKNTMIKNRYNKSIISYRINNLATKVYTKRTTGNQLVIGIDQDRVESRLETKGFTKKSFGSRKSAWTVLSDYEIIMRYNYVIRGFVNYYGRTIRDFSLLNKYIYLLRYSCLHTLANKDKSSIRKVMTKYGNPITVTQLNKKTDIEKSIALLDYESCKDFVTKLTVNQYNKL